MVGTPDARCGNTLTVTCSASTELCSGRKLCGPRLFLALYGHTWSMDIRTSQLCAEKQLFVVKSLRLHGGMARFNYPPGVGTRVQDTCMCTMR